jgi:hypothetical protein
MNAKTTLSLVVLLAVLAVAPAGAVATTAPDAGPQPTAHSQVAQTAPANNTTAESLTAERVASLIRSADADEHAESITAWVTSNADDLDREQAADVYRWLLTRSADAEAEVPRSAIDAVSSRLSEERARSVVADVEASLPEDSVSSLRERLGRLGTEWSADVSGWLGESSTKTATATTTAPTTTASPPPTTAAASGGSGGDGRDGERIDSSLTLVSSSYHPGSGTVTLVLDSDGATAVTLSDAGGFIDGGTINRRTFVAQDGRNSIEFAVTETSRGYVGLSIATEEVLYAEVVRSPTPTPFRDSTGTVGWMAGAGIVLLSFVGAALWKLHNEGGEPVEATV